MLQSIILISTLFFSVSGSDHEFHLSKGLIEYVEAEKALQITMYVFIDDFEEALGKKDLTKLYLCTSKESDSADQHIYDYFKETFSIEVDQQKVTFDYIGKEIAEDMIGMWCYLEVTGVEPFKEIKIDNSLLTEVFDDQKNVINFIGPDRNQTYFILNLKKQTKVIAF